jgi:starch synthase (maltosyl-transferring)
MASVDRQAIGASRPGPAGPQADNAEALTARRVVIERIRPSLDGGRFPIKRTTAESVNVVADIFADGHDDIAAILRDRFVSGSRWQSSGARTSWDWRETPMSLVAPGLDEWSASFTVGEIGWHEYSIVAWVDRFHTWRRHLQLKSAAGEDVSLDLLEGSLLIRETAERATGGSAGRAASPHGAASVEWLLAQADALSKSTPIAVRVQAALDEELGRLMDTYADRSAATFSPPIKVWVDRERARFGAWYEMFPRSAGTDPQRSGTFRDVSALLPSIADLGFDVLYLPPIHPIGRSARKGRNNSPRPRPDDPGSPWAIGSAEGGHTAVEPGLGTLADFVEFRAGAERCGLEIALDLAWQCSPDHPWVREHPEWFRQRLDGTIKFAENPPKKYQDIYPLDFACDDWRALWQELLAVTRFWIDRGVRIFRVDNPHTKTFGFWEWLIDQVHSHDPDVIFLSEAFTRPKPMRYLAKAGFTQSYTHFTWRNSKEELTDYFTELTATDVREYLRPNLFTNTPDILHAYLQEGGRPAFEARLLLAATLGASYGIYSGFEHCERRAVPGTEEYIDSEKYQYRRGIASAPGGAAHAASGTDDIRELIARVNTIRRRHRALQYAWPLRFCATDNPQLIAYSKAAPDGSDPILVVVNLDPHHMQHGFVQTGLDLPHYVVRDLLDDATYSWRGAWNYVRLDPGVRQGHVLQIDVQK